MTQHPEAFASSEDITPALDERFTFGYQQIGELDGDQRWSTWGSCQPLSRGPQPWPDWIITDDAAVDTELGVLKTGKEADVFLLERAAPLDDRAVVLAAKRYRDSAHRTFHRNTDYTDGRKSPKKGGREARAMTKSTTFGKSVAAGRWAWAEWESLVRFYSAGLPVPYPVQIDGTEILMELVLSDDRSPAPRLAASRPDRKLLESLWSQLTDAISGLASLGCVHGDLSAYNLLVSGERLVLIDLPQTVDLFGNPHGMEMLQRDCTNVAHWFRARGLEVDGEELFGEVVARAV